MSPGILASKNYDDPWEMQLLKKIRKQSHLMSLGAGLWPAKRDVGLNSLMFPSCSVLCGKCIQYGQNTVYPW